MQQTPSTTPNTGQNTTTVVRTLGPTFFYFLVAGAATVMLGPLLPALMQHWRIQDAQAGTLFAANFAGQFCGAWIAARNLRGSLISGSILSAAGCLALVRLDFGASHLALFCLGLGLGAGLTAGNIIAGTAIPSARGRLLTILNVSWGVGAIACPLLIHLTAAGGVRRFMSALAALLVTSSLLSIAVPKAKSLAQLLETPSQSAPDRERAKSSLPLPLLPLLAFTSAMFLYVGVENSLGGWLPSYAVRSNPTLQAVSITIYFWTAELAGRLLVAALMTLLSEAALYRLCLSSLLLTVLLFCSVAHLSAFGVVSLTILGGFALAPVFPLLISFMLARTGNHKRLGPLFASASIGGAILPWLTGICSAHFHGLRAGLVVPTAGAALLLLLSGIISARTSHPLWPSA